MYEAEIREDTAEDFDKPRSEMDSAQELMGGMLSIIFFSFIFLSFIHSFIHSFILEYRRQRAEEQEVAKRIHATTEWRRYPPTHIINVFS